MAFEYSPAQKKAIEHRDSDLLVSAAAGSGKTAVLTARVLSLIKEGEKIENMLIVTFTKAAAAQMRQRIISAIEDSDLPNKAEIIQDISRAQISTIDSFCVTFLREFFTFANVDPLFSILDDSRAEKFKAQAVEDVFESFFERYGSDGYEFLTMLGGIDRSKELVLKLNNFASSQSDPTGWKHACLLEYERNCADIGASDWANSMLKKSISNLLSARSRLKTALDLCSLDDFAADFIPVLTGDIAQADDLIALSKLSYAAFADASPTFPRWPSNKNTRQAISKDIIKQYRDDAKKLVEKATQLPPIDAAQNNCRAMYMALSALVTLSDEFEERYSKYKAEDNSLDFADLGHKTFAALSDPNVAETVKQRYSHIFVDEYQDVNELQDSIFLKLSNGKNLFMVGDVKQSIYAFRMAEPDLFVKKYLRFAQMDGGEKIDLNANYRSDKNVLSCVNEVFLRAMTPEMGGVAYDDAAMLHPGKSTKGAPVKIILADRKQTMLDLGDEAPVDDLKANALEAQMVKDEIISRMAGTIIENGEERRVKYSDICILLRSGGFTKELTDALKSASIPYRTDTVSGYYDIEEVKTLLSLLALIDNFHQDLPLIGAMTAPFSNFTPSELIHIRSILPSRDTHFYEAVEKYLEMGDSLALRLKEFMDEIAAWRAFARNHTLDALIHSVLDDTGYYDFLGGLPSGAIRQANIRQLIGKASAFETLSSFMSGIELMKLSSTDKVQETFGDDSDHVRIMTIHKSKGLEYPIVILTGLCKSFNLSDISAHLIIHKRAGFGIKFIDTKLKYTQDTLSRLAVSNAILADSLSEELRILYVAMTRAKNILIMTGAHKNMESAAPKWIDSAQSYDYSTARSYADFIIPALLRHKDGEPLRLLFGYSDPPDISDAEFECVIFDRPDSSSANELPNEIYLPEADIRFDWVKQRLSWEYQAPEGDALNKSGVTALSRNEQQLGIPVPDFIDPKGYQAAARRGTAIHAVMSCLDKDQLKGLSYKDTENNIKDQLDNFLRTGALSEFEAGAVGFDKLAAFFSSQLGKDALSADDLLCEQPFNILFDNRELGLDSEDSDSTMLQGVIDMCFYKDDIWHIIDFKTGFISNEKAKEAYFDQVNIYCTALSRLTGKRTCGFIYLIDRSVTLPLA